MFSGYLRFFLKNLISYLIWILGGFYFLKARFVNRDGLIILSYHNFSMHDNYKFVRGDILKTGYMNNFKKQIRFLSKHFGFCYPEEFFSRACQKGLNILINFDDGYLDNYQIALPILKTYEAKTIFFITTGYMDSDNWLWHDHVRYLRYKNLIDLKYADNTLKNMNAGLTVPQNFKDEVEKKMADVDIDHRLMLSWEEVHKIKDAGFKIGAHTLTHTPLTFINGELQKSEIASSLEQVATKLNKRCNYFCYPNGLYNDKVISILEQENVEYGFSTINGFNDIHQDKKKLKRIGVNASDSIPVLVLKMLYASLRN